MAFLGWVAGLARRIGGPFRRAVREPQSRTSRAGFAFPSSRASPRLNPHPSKTEGIRHPPDGGWPSELRWDTTGLKVRLLSRLVKV
jgi:hypothetical protein